MRFKILLILFIIAPIIVQSQRWKRTRYELNYGVGYTNFFGDIGGGSGKGGHSILSVKDIDFGSSRPSFSLGMRYKAIERLAIKLNFTYGYLSANDKYSTFPGRQNRNESFSTAIFEQILVAEFSVVKERFGRRYTIGNIRSLKKLHINTFFFAGIGGFSFNPKTKINDVPIEGQGPLSTGEAYKKYQIAIPFGIGFKYGLNRKMSFGIEYGNRFTFTDFIDNHKDISPANKANDSYMFLNFNIAYKLRTTRSGLPKF